jgi:hypothetical protein
MRVIASNKVQCNDGNYDITNGAVAPCLNSGGVKIISNSKIDFLKLNDGLLGNSIPFVPPFMQQPKYKTGSDFNKRQEIERQQILALEQAKFNSEKAMSDAQKNKTKEPIYYILVTAGVMIAGYLAYKKFKK